MEVQVLKPGLLTLSLIIFDGPRVPDQGLAWGKDSKGERGEYLLSCLIGLEARSLAVSISALFPHRVGQERSV